MVLFHASVGATIAFGGTLDQVMSFGVAGVDVFFVLSGFIMYISLHARGEPPSPVDFFRRRVIRIAPLYWIATLCLAALYFRRLIEVAGETPFYYIASFLFIPQEVPGHPGEIYPLLSVGWTLNYEMFFYLLLSIALLVRMEFAKLLLGMALALVLIGVVVAPAGPVLSTWTSPLILEFAGGLGIGMAYRRKMRITPWLAGSAAVLAGMVIPFGTSSALLEHSARVVLWGIPALLLVGAATLTRSGAWDNRGILLLGNASYAIYLFHPIAITLLQRGSLSLFGPRETSLGALAFLLLATLIGCGTGIGAHLWIERPIARMFRSSGR